jgi:hypothetical protein
MSSNIPKLSKLLNEMITEVGDLNNIEPYELHSNNTFDINDELYGEIIFDRMNDSIEEFSFPPIINEKKIKYITNVGYSINETESQYTKTSLSILLRIIKTVQTAILNYIKKRPNDVLVIFEEDKFGNLSMGQKYKLYLQILNQNLPSGYMMGDVEFEGGGENNLEGTFICSTKYRVS